MLPALKQGSAVCNVKAADGFTETGQGCRRGIGWQSLIQSRTLDTWNTLAYLEHDLGARQRVDRDQC